MGVRRFASESAVVEAGGESLRQRAKGPPGGVRVASGAGNALTESTRSRSRGSESSAVLFEAEAEGFELGVTSK